MIFDVIHLMIIHISLNLFHFFNPLVFKRLKIRENVCTFRIIFHLIWCSSFSFMIVNLNIHQTNHLKVSPFKRENNRQSFNVVTYGDELVGVVHHGDEHVEQNHQRDDVVRPEHGRPDELGELVPGLHVGDVQV